ncbi:MULTISPECIES: copper-binding protein [Citrobacter]|uniref:Copper-binding protein n=1 Tax=Citrobacter pasteurii TaxID=1563222 RepID=A0A6N6KBV8_9ENTR|nr:copper-binding protein [Citrobacter pasteurii]MBA7944652.1 copper-binding protein [Citrobacter sp. RHBSTW-00271]MBD0799704.1 copper-binding protein [Citrobacter sp. C6_1]MBD0809524.1 copper-binding protein [Citrobacter sp. C6_2]MBA4711174.1 copper-binding protein [Citrobacter pasteurii]
MNKISSFLAIAFFISAGVNAAETSTTHQQATVAHEMMNNSDAPAHQKMAQTHEVQVQNSQSTRASALSFSQMNEHEKAMVVHQSMNNSHSYSHELQAKKHREQAATQG